MLESAVEEQEKNRGTIPAGLQQYIDQWLRPPMVPWPQLLHNICKRTQQTKVGRGICRPSRRLYGISGILPFPGPKRDRRFTVVYALDTSGSMSVADMREGLTEVCHLAKADPEITVHVMHADAVVQHVYEVTSPDDVEWEVHGRGGTTFDPVFIKAKEMLRSQKAPDILIYATDGFAPPPAPENWLPIPVVWLVTPNGVNPSPEYGHMIRMEPYE